MALMAQPSWSSDATGHWSSKSFLLHAGEEKAQHKQTPTKAHKPKKGKKVPAEKAAAELGQSEEKAAEDEQKESATATFSTTATSTPSTFLTDPGTSEECASSDDECCAFAGVTAGTFIGSQGTFIGTQPAPKKSSSSKNSEDGSDDECLKFVGVTPATFMGSDSALERNPSTDSLDGVNQAFGSFFNPSWG